MIFCEQPALTQFTNYDNNKQTLALFRLLHFNVRSITAIVSKTDLIERCNVNKSAVLYSSIV